MKPGTLHTLEDLIAWAHSHEGVIEERWRRQFEDNHERKTSTMVCQTFMQTEIKELRLDIQSMRKLLYIAMGMAMLIGFIAPILVGFFHRWAGFRRG
jgi:hypothetical protein